MGHFKTLLMKFSANGLPVFLILYFAGRVDLVTSLILTVVLIGVAYVLGDMLILPKTGNIAATIADIALTVILLLGVRQLGITIRNEAIIYIAIAVALTEGLFYHPYLKRLVSLDAMGPRFGKRD